MAFVSTSSFSTGNVPSFLQCSRSKQARPRTARAPRTLLVYAKAVQPGRSVVSVPTQSQSTGGEDTSSRSSRVAVADPQTTCFGKAPQFPRRTVGLYELERAGLNPRRIFDDGNTRNDGFLGLIVGVFVLALLVPALVTPDVSIEGPVSFVAGILLTIWAIDSLALNSILTGAASVALQPKDRVAMHEAGHFLVAYLRGCKVLSYQLPNVQALLQGEECGVQVDLSCGDAYDIAAVGMAGIAAECKTYGISEGGRTDMMDVCNAVLTAPNESRRPQTKEDAKRVARWGLLQATLVLNDHAEAHRALADAMKQGKSLEDCVEVVERAFDWSKAKES